MTIVESMIWRDRNLNNFNLIFFPNYPPPDHNLGQILNSDPARSYFPLKARPWEMFVTDISYVFVKHILNVIHIDFFFKMKTSLQ